MTLEDRATFKAIVAEAIAEAMKPAPVLERTEPAPVEKQRKTVQQLLDMVREYRATLKKHDKVMEQFRNHAFDSKNASRAIESVRNELEAAEEGFVAFCKLVADGTMTIERGT